MISAPKPSISLAQDHHSATQGEIRPGRPGPATFGFPVADEANLISATVTKAERPQQIAPAPASNAAEATSASPEATETSFPGAGRADHAVTATVTNQEMAPAAASDAEKNRKFLENVVVWPGRNDTGWINMHVTVKGELPGHVKDIGWPFKNLDAFINRARWASRIDEFLGVRVCMSQQSECTTTRRGKPKAVTEGKNATWRRSLWIDCKLKATGRKHYRTPEDAWDAIVAFKRKLGFPFPSAVVKSGDALQVYWISDIPLTVDEWGPYAYGLELLMRREGVKCDAFSTYHSTQLLSVPGTMDRRYTPPRRVEVVHLGRRYDFSSTFSVLRNTAVETRAAARLAWERGQFGAWLRDVHARQTSALETKHDRP